MKKISILTTTYYVFGKQIDNYEDALKYEYEYLEKMIEDYDIDKESDLFKTTIYKDISVKNFKKLKLNIYKLLNEIIKFKYNHKVDFYLKYFKNLDDETKAFFYKIRYYDEFFLNKNGIFNEFDKRIIKNKINLFYYFIFYKRYEKIENEIETISIEKLNNIYDEYINSEFYKEYKNNLLENENELKKIKKKIEELREIKKYYKKIKEYEKIKKKYFSYLERNEIPF